ncbi:MAG TPA: hypothetical protein DHW42_05155 [Candidatus Marinimicrobia bacterium]|nr:hypothetical protein [Candidatus Neomarinimicrobiota bacterium]
MSIRAKFKKEIVSKSDIPNIDGYVKSNSDNLIEGITSDLFEKDLQQGSGSELESKFNALYSSSALVVNSFALIKKILADFSFKGLSNFTGAQFERKFPTNLGGTPPNLDFALENSNSLIAFESKYLELLAKKEVKFSESYKKANLAYLNDFWFDLIDFYKGSKNYLDVAQLIKHSIGLINYRAKSNKILVYIYWHPDNHVDFEEYTIHAKEIEEFAERLKEQQDIEFCSITYSEFWDYCKQYNDLKNMVDNIEK